MKRIVVVLMLALSGAALAEEGDGDVDRINGSINIAADQQAGELSTVNGSIRIGAGAKVGAVSTVNGSVSVSARATADSIETVNGSIALGDGARISDDVTSVNGALTLNKGADVAGSLENVNGRISLDAAHVSGGIKTVSGDIDIGPGSRVDGGITIEKITFNWTLWRKHEVPHVVIGPAAVVHGTLKFERAVELYVSDRATVGPIVGAKPIKFSGDHPPQ